MNGSSQPVEDSSNSPATPQTAAGGVTSTTITGTLTTPQTGVATTNPGTVQIMSHANNGTLPPPRSENVFAVPPNTNLSAVTMSTGGVSTTHGGRVVQQIFESSQMMSGSNTSAVTDSHNNIPPTVPSAPASGSQPITTQSNKSPPDSNSTSNSAPNSAAISASNSAPNLAVGTDANTSSSSQPPGNSQTTTVPVTDMAVSTTSSVSAPTNQFPLHNIPPHNTHTTTTGAHTAPQHFTMASHGIPPPVQMTHPSGAMPLGNFTASASHHHHFQGVTTNNQSFTNQAVQGILAVQQGGAGVTNNGILTSGNYCDTVMAPTCVLPSSSSSINNGTGGSGSTSGVGMNVHSVESWHKLLEEIRRDRELALHELNQRKRYMRQAIENEYDAKKQQTGDQRKAMIEELRQAMLNELQTKKRRLLNTNSHSIKREKIKTRSNGRQKKLRKFPRTTRDILSGNCNGYSPLMRKRFYDTHLNEKLQNKCFLNDVQAAHDIAQIQQPFRADSIPDTSSNGMNPLPSVVEIVGKTLHYYGEEFKENDRIVVQHMNKRYRAIITEFINKSEIRLKDFSGKSTRIWTMHLKTRRTSIRMDD